MMHLLDLFTVTASVNAYQQCITIVHGTGKISQEFNSSVPHEVAWNKSGLAVSLGISLRS